ncbi:hypothetical protein CUMW_277280 [Citrus unshiu]|uniref:Uncharacterized protein n=1 Tax=Citrus unshiu TaxID=55188 RepID=A0A2H5N3L4_CITUN|nr:hypothetical protein CUMW_277280 [Citrus unshiu]
MSSSGYSSLSTDMMHL